MGRQSAFCCTRPSRTRVRILDDATRLSGPPGSPGSHRGAATGCHDRRQPASPRRCRRLDGVRRLSTKMSASPPGRRTIRGSLPTRSATTVRSGDAEISRLAVPGTRTPSGRRPGPSSDPGPATDARHTSALLPTPGTVVHDRPADHGAFASTGVSPVEGGLPGEDTVDLGRFLAAGSR